MAGIGFNLQKILEGDSFFASIKAHFYSAMICAGPWLLSIVTLFCLNWFAPRNIDVFELTLFRGVIIYTFAFSLIGIGILHFPLTRYLADKLYAKEEEAIIPVFNATAVFAFVFQGSSALAFCGFSDFPATLKAYAVMIYMTVSLLWLLMIFLTALRDYKAIVVSYLAGSVLTVIVSLWAGRAFGLGGYFAGYLIGHFTIAVLWTARIFIEFQTERVFDTDFFGFIFKQKTLVFIGFFYNFAIWIDKIIFWLSPHATTVFSNLRVFPAYDSAVFFAYLTIIPALSIFLLQIETDFYKLYRRYYMEILNKSGLSSIRKVRRLMAGQIRKSAALLLRYQGILSLLIITFAPEIADLLHIPWMQIPIFRITVVGAFLHALLLMVLIIILYFDFQILALRVAGIFFVTNALFTYITTKMEMLFFGYGYLAAALISLMAAFYMLDFRFKKLEFYTFAVQPVGAHREEEVA